MCLQVVAVCVVAYVAGIAVLASVAPVIHTASLNIHSHHPPVNDQSPLSDELPTLNACEPADMKSFDPEPSSLPQTLTTRPLSFLINLFHLVAFTENAVSSSSIPPGSDSTIFDSSSVNSTTCPHLSGKGHLHSYCTNRNLAKAYKGVCGCRQSVLKRTKTGSYHHAAPPYQHPVFPHYLSSLDELSPASESVTPAWITPPLPHMPNASFLFRFETLVEPV